MDKYSSSRPQAEETNTTLHAERQSRVENADWRGVRGETGGSFGPLVCVRSVRAWLECFYSPGKADMMQQVATLVLMRLLCMAAASEVSVNVTTSERSEAVGPPAENDNTLTSAVMVSTQDNSRENNVRRCTVEELLPRETAAKSGTMSSEWSNEHIVEPPYSCKCPSSKGRYYCPHLGSDGYPKWVPHAVAEGVCKDVKREEMLLRREPLPPNSKILFSGNSHMRQVVEAILCLFQDSLVSKRVAFASAADPTATEYLVVSGDEPCRAVFPDDNQLLAVLANSGCIDLDGYSRCHDDSGEFVFSNGATIHYHYAGGDQEHKKISDALVEHGDVDFSYYDAVFANQGNPPPVKADLVIGAAFELRKVGVPLFWLSEYDGKGNPKTWTADLQSEFLKSGAYFVSVGDMARGLHHLKKGSVEQMYDPHFCMPGPPDEIGLLLLNLVWALHYENIS